MYLKATGILLAIFCLKAFSNDKIIYGEDNRVDYYDTTALYQELANSTAAMIPRKSLIEKDDYFEIKGETLSERGICKEERFSQQMSAAFCSGFLVAPDLLVTAGHCITSQVDCAKYTWVFDYRLENANDKANKANISDVYYCKEIIERKLSNVFKNDYALIRLHKKTNRPGLKFRNSGKIQKDTQLVVIGHPSGLPTKIADGAIVRETNWNYFKANLDTYGGNSGSAVFDAITGEVEGILVRGGTDYITSRNYCNISNRIGNDQGEGEDVTYITNIKYLKKL